MIDLSLYGYVSTLLYLFFEIYVVVTGALIVESMVYRFGNSLKTTSIEDLLVNVKME